MSPPTAPFTVFLASVFTAHKQNCGELRCPLNENLLVPLSAPLQAQQAQKQNRKKTPRDKSNTEND